MNTLLLEAKEVTKTYEKSAHPSLNKVSFCVAEGGIYWNYGGIWFGKDHAA